MVQLIIVIERQEEEMREKRVRESERHQSVVTLSLMLVIKAAETTQQALSMHSNKQTKCRSFRYRLLFLSPQREIGR